MNRLVALFAAALLLAPAATVAFAPAPAFAQYDGVMAPATGDAGATQDNNGFGNDGGGGYDQQFQKQGTPNNIYEFVNKPDTKRDLQKAQEETAKKRDAMVKRMQANSARILEQQKERAWKIANPGKPYHADGVPDDGTGTEDTTADDGTGDDGMGDTGDDTADQGGDDGSDGGGDGFQADTGFGDGDSPESGQP